jgi:CubicO group peptidase (beta-lactamase class C family)
MSQETKSIFNPSWVKEWIEREINTGAMAGCAIEVVHHGKSVLSETFGQRNSNGDPVTHDTRFWIASMTKPVVSVAALQLFERGDFTFSDPVSEFIPGFGEAGVITPSGSVEPIVRPPNIMDLFLHTTGVTYGQFGGDEIHRRYKETGVYDFSIANAEMASRLATLPTLHQPGTVFEYGMSTDLLGRVIEVLTGKSLDKALQDLLLAPLGMEHTSFVPSEGKLAELAPSIIQQTMAPDFKTKPVWLSGGAGLFSTASDYMIFARMLLGGGQLGGQQFIKPETFANMCRNHLPPNVGYGAFTPSLGITGPLPQNGLGYGLGVSVRTVETDHIPGGLGEFLWPGVSGGNFWVDPKNEIVVVFTTHAPLERVRHRTELRNAIYQGLYVPSN